MPLRETKSDMLNMTCTEINAITNVDSTSVADTAESKIIELYDVIKPFNETPNTWPTDEFPSNDPAILTTEARMEHRPCTICVDMVGTTEKVVTTTEITVLGSDTLASGKLSDPITLASKKIETNTYTGNLAEFNLTGPDTPRYVQVKVKVSANSTNRIIVYKKLV